MKTLEEYPNQRQEEFRTGDPLAGQKLRRVSSETHQKNSFAVETCSADGQELSRQLGQAAPIFDWHGTLLLRLGLTGFLVLRVPEQLKHEAS